MASVFKGNEFFDVLSAARVSDVCDSKRKLLTLNDTNSLEFALKLLAEHKILSVPVANGRGAIVGYIDRMAILRFVFDKLPSLDDITADVLANYPLGKATCKELIESSSFHHGKFVCTMQENPASFLVEMFQYGIHRTVVYGEVQQDFRYQVVPTGICSQSDIVRYLANHMDDADAKLMGAVPITKFCEVKKAVLSVDGKQSMISALDNMQKNDVARLAVVDADGKLIGNLSSSDLRSLNTDNLPDILMSVEEYLKKHSSKSLSPVCVKDTQSIGQLIHMFANSGLHHAYIKNEDDKPAGIVTLTDFMRATVHFRLAAEDRKEIEKTILTTPGDLTVRIVAATNLATQTTSSEVPITVSMTLKGHPDARCSAVGKVFSTGISAEFDQAAFVVRVTGNDVDKTLQFDVFNSESKSQFGDLQVKMDWVLDAFGSKNQAVKTYRETLKLNGVATGDLEIDMLFSPDSEDA
jgi:CBS domain-containing protein